jgi:hypothetical protein
MRAGSNQELDSDKPEPPGRPGTLDWQSARADREGGNRRGGESRLDFTCYMATAPVASGECAHMR